MAEITIATNKQQEIIDITQQINGVLPKSFHYGICHLLCPHTTAAIALNENADFDVKQDLLTKLDMLVPAHEKFYRHAEGNSAAHIKTVLVGSCLSLPFSAGRLELGIWQGVYFCEFDGPRMRRVKVSWQPAEA